MTHHIMKNAALSALAVAALGWAASAQAAGDYHIKFGGVDGDTGGKDDGKHSDWIIIESVRLAPDAAPRAGGVHVASGDVNGDGAAATSGHATGKRQHMPVRVRGADQASKPAPGKIAAADPDSETTALLLPAVQKVREAAARMPAWGNCAAGQTFKGMEIRQVSTGRTGRILDATVATCAAESVSFNFTKIEWN